MSASILRAPSALAAAATATTTVQLNWKDNDTTATGYNVLRSTDGKHYTKLATLNSGVANSYTDGSTVAGMTYDYEIQAYNRTKTSAASNVATAKAKAATVTPVTPIAPAAGVSITMRYGNELVVTAAGARDSISISESGSILTINADGQVFTETAAAGGLFVYTRGGADSINIAGTVTAQTTLETIDNALTTITSSGTNVTAWIDSTDAFAGAGNVHRVATFAGGVSKAAGAALANPTDAGATVKVNASLFGTGPIANDVNQGEAGDCYFLSSLAAFAGQSPQTLVQSAVDMGDGTYTVQFISNSKPVFVRVSNAFSSGPINGFMFAQPGTDGSVWAMVMEKAWADFRTGANTYASINSGWMGSVYTALGVNSTSFTPSSFAESSFYSMLSTDLAAGKEVTLGTNQSPPNLVGGHAYTLISVSKDSNGVTHYVVRNPWGVSGDSSENSQGYATLTFSQMAANFQDGCAAA